MKNMKLTVIPWVALAAIALLGISIGWFTLGFWSTIQQTEHCTAVVRTRVNNPANKFIGASGGIVIYKPRVQNGQSSSARIKLVNGAHSIEAGWMVNPDVFGDDSPHLYTRFSAKGKTCINTQCHGFVQVQTKYPLGISARYSMAGGAQYVWYISIEKREEDKWWVFLSSEKVAIGYWPAKLVTGLSESASVVEWGGEVTNPGLVTPSPEMGNGKKARYDSIQHGLCKFQFSTRIMVDHKTTPMPPRRL